MSNGPVEPNAEMRMFATNLRQMYLALRAEGFDEREALAIVGQVIAVGMAGGKS